MKLGARVAVRVRRPSFGRVRFSVVALVALLAVTVPAAALAAGSGPVHAQKDKEKGKKTDDPAPETNRDVSPPLRSIAPISPKKGPPSERTELELPPHAVAPSAPDTALQPTFGSASAPALGSTFEGIGQGFTGPAGTFTVNSAPPDTNGAVGPNNYVQIVNSAFAIFSKSGAVQYGPAQTRTLWSGFGGGCQANNDGDAIVVYDRAADRFIISQFSVTAPYPFLQCVAVSTSSDPTGSYYRYSFQYNNFPDYPKLGTWPDGFYVTFNLFNSSGTTFLGPEMCSYDRAKMLIGAAATQQCFTLSTAYDSLLPASNDGATPPPAGAPNYALNTDTNSLDLWKFHVDWTTPSNSYLIGPTSTIPVAAFTPGCTTGGACIPQPGTSQRLDSLGDRLMSRLVYRNFGDHESIVVTHSINAGSSVGVRWYELRNLGGTPTVYQQGTFAPDSTYRWMGSAAMDGSGNIGLGYSVSSSSVSPGIRYTGHITSDPLGVMGQGEGTLWNGSGSQLTSLARWGDYSSMTVDPVDDCTFWYTNEYIASSGTFNWHTRIGTFTLPGCGVQDFSLSVSPSSQSVLAGQAALYTVTVTPSGSFAGQATLSVSGLPTGATASFLPNPTGSTSALSVTTVAGTPAGSYPLTITGTSGSITHSTPATLVVSQPPPGDFSLSASPAIQTVAQGQSATYTVTVNPGAGFSGTVALSAQVPPAGTTSTFTPNPTGTSSTLTITTSAATEAGWTYTVTITGTSGGLTRQTTVTLGVQSLAPPAPDWSLSAAPTSQNVSRGSSTSYTITVQRINGFSGAVSFSVSGVPYRSSASFSPNPTTGDSTLTVLTNRRSSTGSFPLTITGSSGGVTRTTTVTLSIR